jgi:hypothetical protein
MSNTKQTFLQKVGSEFKTIATDVNKVFAKADPIVQEAEPYITLFFPGFGSLFTTIANEVISTEQKFAAIGQQSGSGKAKLASVLAVVGPVAQQILSSAKLPSDEATVNSLINGVVGLLNAVPAPVATATA